MFCLNEPGFQLDGFKSSPAVDRAAVSGLPYMALITAGVVVAVIMPHTLISSQNKNINLTDKEHFALY